jgi:hypothetical protein
MTNKQAQNSMVTVQILPDFLFLIRYFRLNANNFIKKGLKKGCV